MKAKKLAKKLAAVVCCFSCIMGLHVETMAMETEYIAVTPEIQEGITAYVIDENGQKEALDCEVSLKKSVSNARAAGDWYTLEVKASNVKDSYDDITQEGIQLSGRISWIDNLGIPNILTSVSGRFENTSKIKSAYYQYGTLGEYFSSKNMELSRTNSFLESLWKEGAGFRLELSARTKDDKKISLTVKTSIFD